MTCQKKVLFGSSLDQGLRDFVHKIGNFKIIHRLQVNLDMTDHCTTDFSI